MLYYVKTLEELAKYLEDGEVIQGSNLSNTLETNPNMFADEGNVMLKLQAAEAELEMILANRGFSILSVRSANNLFLNMCVAVFCWFNMEINGEGREIITKRYREYVKRLTELDVIVTNDGLSLYPVASSESIDRRRKAPLIARRPLNRGSL